MLTEERYKNILEMLEKNNAVTVNNLKEKFNVSLETIRRDLFHLEKQGLLKRVHGGAVSIKKDYEFHEFSQRLDEKAEQKEYIADLAVSLIEEGDSIALGAGTTSLSIARRVKEKFKTLTVITNSTVVMNELLDYENFNVIVPGGYYLKKECCLYGAITIGNIKNFHVKKAFVSPSGISLDYGVSDYIPELIEVDKTYISIADTTIFLADSSKFNNTGLIKMCDLEQSHVIVTDNKLSDEIFEIYTKNKIKILR